MITSITLQNFKGIRDKAHIELKPITLLFGANSSGKSTVLQAIHYAREILERHNLDPDRTLYGGDAIDLGGFRNLVYNRDLTRQILIRFDIDLTDIDLPEYKSLNEKASVSNLSRASKSAWVEMKIEWSRFREHPILMSYDVGINGIEIAGIYTSDGSRHIPKCNMYHPLVIEEEPNVDDPTQWFEFESESLSSCLPQWGKCLKVEATEAFYENLGYEPERFNRILSQVLVGPGEVLRDLLREFRYLGPLRQVPPRNYQPALTRNELHWADGRAAWDILYRNGQPFIDEVNQWLSSTERLNTGYSLRMKRYKELDIVSPLAVSLNMGTVLDDIEDIKAELEKIPTKQRLMLYDEQKNLEVLPQDIGVGISQVIPVVVAALDKGADIVAVEQPELHVHPAIQVNLSDLFISQISKDRTFLIETHSEHILLRIMRRIRETNYGSIAEQSLALKADDVIVYFVEIDSSQCIFREMPLNENGELVKAWPGGFFEEGLREMF